MDRFDRIYRLHGQLSNRHTPITLKQIMEHLECSKATANRMIETLRDTLNAPLEYSREHNGYFYNQDSSVQPYELPGLWFSAEELQGLLICQQILQDISPGILSEQIKTLQKRITTMLSKANSLQAVVADKIQFTAIGRRLKDDSVFKRIASGLFSEKRLFIQYHARGQDGTVSEREISPYKLVFYRDNWYLCTRCHLRDELRIFSVDNIRQVTILPQPVQAIDAKELDQYLHSAYGIFTGKAEHIAVLEFSSTRAQWVADEYWHPDQQGQWLDNGNYQLSIPFKHSPELLMDILKYGADVKVIAPAFLQQAVKNHIQAMQKVYAEK
jgi:predicted DNA-binding transcriptional regulator YafY